MELPNQMTSNSPILRGTRGSHLQDPRSPTPNMTSVQSQQYYRPIESPLTVGFAGPRPYRAPSFSPVHINYSSTAVKPEYAYNPTHPLQPPSPAFEQAYGYAVPLECATVPPKLSQFYVIYDEGDENTLSTAEIIERQSQDYVDEQLAQFEMMTIAKLQGKFIYLEC